MEQGYAIAHWSHTILFLILFMSGLLIFFPEARLYLFSGYSLVFSEAHRYSGVLYLPITIAFVIIARKKSNNHSGNIKGWKKIHILLLGIGSAVLFITGVILWSLNIASPKLIDHSAFVHEIFTLFLGILFALHIFFVVAKKYLKRGVQNG